MTATHLAFIGFAVILAIILAFSFIVLWKILVGDIHLEGLLAKRSPPTETPTAKPLFRGSNS